MRHQAGGDADCDYTTLYDAFGAQYGCLDPLTQTQSQPSHLEVGALRNTPPLASVI